jgi:hypothetical protein
MIHFQYIDESVTSTNICISDREVHRQRIREATSTHFGLTGWTEEASELCASASARIKLTDPLRKLEENLVLNLDYVMHILHEDGGLIVMPYLSLHTFIFESQNEQDM